MSKRIVWVVLALGSIGCGFSVAPTNLPNGHTGYALTCREIADCWRMAGTECKHGYQVVNSAEGTDAIAVANRNMAFGTMHGHYSLLVECNAPMPKHHDDYYDPLQTRDGN